MTGILANGLLVNSGMRSPFTRFSKDKIISSYYEKYGMQPLFLTNDVEHTIKQLGKNSTRSCMVLKIDVTGLNMEGEFDYLEEKWYMFYKNRESMIDNMRGRRGITFISKENIKPSLMVFCPEITTIINNRY